MLKEIKEALSEFTALCGDDKEKLEIARTYADDVHVIEELVPKLKKNEHFSKSIKELEDSLEAKRNAILWANLNETPDEVIRNLISGYQTLRAALRELRGKDEDELKRQLDRSVAALKEEKEVQKDLEK